MEVLESWAQENKIVLLDVENKPSLRVFYLSEGEECLQVVVEDKEQEIRVDVWSVETLNDEELHHTYIFPASQLTKKLDEVVGKVRSWFWDRNALP